MPVVIDWDGGGLSRLFKSPEVAQLLAAEAARRSGRLNVKARSLSHSPMRHYFGYRVKRLDHAAVAIIYPTTKAAHYINAKHHLLESEAHNA